ncbi:hypothetical protein, partial [Phaeobacter sp. B1627]|uniref:hypothetical protein n=1 Tax=Phaeobacter sp. B1627 TaxID=2583809 RepID=UPI001C3FFE74
PGASATAALVRIPIPPSQIGHAVCLLENYGRQWYAEQLRPRWVFQGGDFSTKCGYDPSIQGECS